MGVLSPNAEITVRFTPTVGDHFLVTPTRISDNGDISTWEAQVTIPNGVMAVQAQGQLGGSTMNRVLITWLMLFTALPAAASILIPGADGSDGAFNPSASVEIDLGLATTGDLGHARHRQRRLRAVRSGPWSSSTVRSIFRQA